MKITGVNNNETVGGLGKVKRLRLVSQTADLLRSSIETGSLSPGMHLVENNLAQQLEVSRGTVREALRMLESEGLVASYPGRGTFITSLDVTDLEELYSLRRLLEQEAVTLACRHSTPAQMERLEDITRSLLDAARRSDLPGVIDLDMEFHRQIWEMSGHRRLILLLEGILLQTRMYLAVNTRLYEDLATGVADHQTILEAVRRQDAPAAARQMQQHIDEAAHTVVAYIRKRE